MTNFKLGCIWSSLEKYFQALWAVLLNCADLQSFFFLKSLDHQRFDVAHLICADLILQGHRLCSPTYQWRLPAVLWVTFPSSTSTVLICTLSREQVLLFPHQGCEDSNTGRSCDKPGLPLRWSVYSQAGSLMPLQDINVACTPTAGKNKDANRRALWLCIILFSFMWTMNNVVTDKVNLDFAEDEMNGGVIFRLSICSVGRQQLFLISPSSRPLPLPLPDLTAGSVSAPTTGAPTSVLSNAWASSNCGGKTVPSKEEFTPFPFTGGFINLLGSVNNLVPRCKPDDSAGKIRIPQHLSWVFLSCEHLLLRCTFPSCKIYSTPAKPTFLPLTDLGSR